ncbi:hypothetical protein C8R31_102255 [Nitrosospira sp. Nsp2]|nr:hypothetical protein C8R31_102255 [Nitrosospira sp. Nsp2]
MIASYSPFLFTRIRFDSDIVIKRFALLFLTGLAHSSQASAQEPDSFASSGITGEVPSGMIGAGPLMHGSPVPPGQFPPAPPYPASPYGNHQYGQYGQQGNWAGRPIVMLPMPLPMNNGAGFNNPYGFQFPGSYMPRETPLHKFNGYEVCDPPSLAENAGPGTPSSPPARRLVKITSTRSLAAPGSSQPCPIYTINGQLPRQNSYATGKAPAPQNGSPPRTKP